jgi:putative flippase GtrA
MFMLLYTQLATTPLLKRFSKYTLVGVSTYLFDLGIVALLTYGFGMHYTYAVGIGFLIGISVNYQITYHWVFKGTERRKLTGYIIFGLLALLGMTLIMTGTSLLTEQFGLPLLIARTLVGGFLGIVGFLVNSIFNFKMF